MRRGCGAGGAVWWRRIAGEDLKGWVRLNAPLNKRCRFNVQLFLPADQA